MCQAEGRSQPRPYGGALTPLQAASAMQAARLNARDLLETAELLYSLKRFAHSAALSTLALEEAGKLPILQGIFLGVGGDQSKLWRAYRRHQAKTRTITARLRFECGQCSPSFLGIPRGKSARLGQLPPNSKR